MTPRKPDRQHPPAVLLFPAVFGLTLVNYLIGRRGEAV